MATLKRVPDKISYWAIKWKENGKWEPHQRDCTGSLQSNLANRWPTLPKEVVFYMDFIDEFLPHLPVFKKFLRKMGATSADVVVWDEEDMPHKRIFTYAPHNHNVLRVYFNDIQNNCFNIMVAHLIMRRILYPTKFLLDKEEREPGYIAKVFQSPEAMGKEHYHLRYYTGTLFVSYREMVDQGKRYKTWTGVFNNTQRMEHRPHAQFMDFLTK